MVSAGVVTSGRVPDGQLHIANPLARSPPRTATLRRHDTVDRIVAPEAEHSSRQSSNLVSGPGGSAT
jgi:hypothetical protein